MPTASAQSDQVLCCTLTELLDTINSINRKQIPDCDFARARYESESMHFAHVRRHFFVGHDSFYNVVESCHDKIGEDFY